MILVSLWTQTGFGVVFKIIQVYERCDGANKMQIEHRVVGLKLFHIQSKEIGNNKNYEETTELEKWQRFRLNIEVRKEMEDSRLNAIEVRKTVDWILAVRVQQQLMLILRNLF